MSIKTSNTDFKTRIRQQIEDPIMRKAVANAQQRIGGKSAKKMVDELGALGGVARSGRPDT